MVTKTAALCGALMVLTAAPAVAQEGDAAAGRGRDQDLVYVTAETVSPVRIQLPVDYDEEATYTLVVGLHGHGGRGDEFFTPAPRFAEAGFIYAVLQAPYALPMAGRIGYSWNLRRVDDDAGDQGEEDLSIRYILKAVDMLQERFQPRATFLMGFSQGGTMTYQTALAHPEEFAGFAVFGSWYRSEWFAENELRAANHLAVFIGHGRQDRVVERSNASKDIFEALDFEVTVFDYEGGHTIAAAALDELFSWMRRRAQEHGSPPVD